MIANRVIVAEDLQRIARAPLPWAEFEGASILVTGATGFISAYLIEALLHLNDQVLSRPIHVLALARNREKIARRFEGIAPRPDLHFIEQDVCVPLPPAIRFDYAIHAASLACPRFYLADPVGTLTANIVGTSHVLQRAAVSK
jgi:UDP-glucuronate decarboxylase